LNEDENGNEKVGDLIDRDRREGFIAVEEMDEHLKEIAANVWEKPQTDIHALKLDIEELYDHIQNFTITVDEAESALRELKLRYDGVTSEREQNEHNALKYWIELPSIRYRLLKFEERLMGFDRNDLSTDDIKTDHQLYGRNQMEIIKIDNMRAFINDLAIQLKAVYEYYFISDDDLLNAGIVISQTENNLTKRRDLLPTQKPKNRCIWFFCF
uniref:t-SNARE coiled-coil homology domain-containing protein n=1 Tax=Anisakis simplex TaxID=6269 RepID=A0A0M3JS25_ANISI